MENYRVVPAQNGFQVIETRADGCRSSVGGFSTEAEAKGWLDSFTLLIGLIDCMAGTDPTPRSSLPVPGRQASETHRWSLPDDARHASAPSVADLAW
jgi:hypothetical protein